MAMANFTEDGKKNQLDRLQCLADLTSGIRYQLTGVLGLNIFLSVSTFLGNTLILVALRKESSLHPPSKLLFRCLATTDLCVGLIAQPVAVLQWTSVLNERLNICRFVIKAHFIIGYTLSSVSMLTLTAISLDRFLALLLGLRYRQVVTLRRTFVTTVSFWIVSTVASTMYFWSAVITLWYGMIGSILCLIISIFSYTKIFLKLSNQQTQVQDHTQQPSQTIPLSMARYRKAVSTVLWFQLTFVVCFLPNGIVQALTSASKVSPLLLLVRKYTVTLVYLNSSFNPILYCWRIKEVRKAVKDAINQLLHL
ncbi:melanocyte-stimulating hormone receptor-like [Oculina patagonica]